MISSLLIFCTAIFLHFQVPVLPDTVTADTISAPSDTVEAEVPEVEEAMEEQLRIVATWPDVEFPGYDIAETDSTLRWFMALNWSERLYREPGVITYRTGRLGQPSGIDIHSYENRHQQLMINEMNVTDPVTGQVNWNRVPIHKLRSVQINDRSYNHRAIVTLREFYMVQPKTYLNFDEGKDEYRSLEFSFTHNFTPETNLELSFWDRKDGDRYPRNSMEGRQIVAKGRHHLSDEVMLKAGFINNALDQQQPFGYNVFDLSTFDFNPFIATAAESNANSNYSTNDLYFQLMQRENEDEPVSRSAGINMMTDQWELTFSQDTTGYNLRDINVFAWQNFTIRESTVRARASGYALRDKSRRSLTTGTWLGWETSVEGEIPLLSWVSTRFTGAFRGRNDGRTGYEGSINLELRPFQWLTFEGFGGIGSSIPDLQSLYWSSSEYQGNELLQNETGIFGGASSRLQLGPNLAMGLRGDTREVVNGIFINQQGSFINIDPYINLSGAAWLELNSSRFEGSLSATGHTFISSSAYPVNQRLDQGGERLWLKGSLYWKNYVFNKAAYIKAGVSGMFSPGNYIPSEFVEPMNRWQHGLGDRYLPDFHRLDIDISARIRWFMLMLKWENVLDRLTQLGYFETDDYPMPGFRFTLGLRVVFTN